MTAMPQMVAIFNGAGGGAAALVVDPRVRCTRARLTGGAPVGEVIAILLGLMIGAVSFSGSIIAFGKLQGLIDAKAFKYAGQQLVTGGLFAGMLLLALALVADAAGMMDAPNEARARPRSRCSRSRSASRSSCRSAERTCPSSSRSSTPTPVSRSRWRASRSGTRCSSSPARSSAPRARILTRLMSKAMNRSLTNVLFGAFGAATAATAGAKTDDGRSFREVSAEDAAILLGYAQSVIIVPGYGLAVAQAQHNVRELADLLEAKGIEVKYAIHPVAGRMPGHMNVLLAEANVPYEKLFDMEQINEDFQRADVALVIGANDVTNPAARKDTVEPDLRDADPQRRPGAEHHRDQALDEARLRRHRQRALSRSQDGHALRRREGGRLARRRRAEEVLVSKVRGHTRHGEELMRRLFVLLAVISLLVVSGGDAYGTKPGPGTSTGSGRVFFPNPVAQLQDQTLTDQNDADYAALQPAYRSGPSPTSTGAGSSPETGR